MNAKGPAFTTHFNGSRSRHILNQQQLQIARSALWHQTVAGPGSSEPSAALVTYDGAAAWLKEIGLCLFLPRHAQLPAPAPSFVEAFMGAARALPPPETIVQATELANRLIDARRVVPLNLLGAYTEQPDFLIPADVLPWVAAVRGDRQWKAAPSGRSSPLIVRIWEALDRQGEATAVELREILGRELTEAAVLRALIELWTSVRAIPVATPARPTRWTLLKHRHPTELATAANTAQATALSALLSIYLRSAVAATAEEAEVFLSPLTSRSRIREVLHGMMAARQFATMSVASQTLVFVEGSLPEVAVEPQPELATSAPSVAALPTLRPPFRKGPREEKLRHAGIGSRERSSRQKPYTASRSEKHFEKPFKKPYRKVSTGAFPSPARDNRPGQRQPGGRRSGMNEARPWQRNRPAGLGRAGSGDRPSKPWQKNRPDTTEDPELRPQNPSGPQKPWRNKPPQSGFRKPFEKGRRPADKSRPASDEHPRRAPFSPSRKLSGSRNPGTTNPRVSRPGNRGGFSPRPGKPADDRPAGPFRSGKFSPGNRSSARTDRPQRSGDRIARPGQPFTKPFKKPFRKAKSTPAKQKPRKNRSQEENSE